jgi:hypothetical protein
MVTDVVAFVGEPDGELRQLIVGILQTAGYTVVECASAGQLRVRLHSRVAYVSERLVLVVCEELATQCGAAIAKLGKTRSLTEFARPLVVVLSAAVGEPVFPGCDVVVVPLERLDAQQAESWTQRFPQRTAE